MCLLALPMVFCKPLKSKTLETFFVAFLSYLDFETIPQKDSSATEIQFKDDELFFLHFITSETSEKIRSLHPDKLILLILITFYWKIAL